ncbi:MAG: hypothetical protein MZW92_27290 [Comamonadaceae bacterium]|nr:hypothetical protein [Comamonadaceae bacterium]
MTPQDSAARAGKFRQGGADRRTGQRPCSTGICSTATRHSRTCSAATWSRKAAS